MIPGKWVIWHDNQTYEAAMDILQRWLEKFGKEMAVVIAASVLHPGKYAIWVCKI